MFQRGWKYGAWFPGFLLVAAVALGPLAESQAADVITLRLGHVVPSGHPYDLGVKKFKELIEARTQGKVKIEIFPNGALGGERDMVEGARLGTVELVVTAGDIVAGISGVRKMFIFNVPFVFESYDQFGKVMEGPVGEELNQLFAAKGYRNVGWMTAGFHQLLNRAKPIKHPDDMKGLKMRMWESKGAQLGMRALGATVIPMAFTEVYTGLQQGVIDGLSNSYVSFYMMKFHEVTKYVSITNHFIVVMALFMGEDTFQKLPADVQKAVLECGKEAARFQRGLYVDADKKYLDILKKESKLQFNEVNREAFVKNVVPYHKEFAELIGGPDAKQYVERVIKEAAKAR